MIVEIHSYLKDSILMFLFSRIFLVFEDFIKKKSDKYINPLDKLKKPKNALIYVIGKFILDFSV